MFDGSPRNLQVKEPDEKSCSPDDRIAQFELEYRNPILMERILWQQASQIRSRFYLDCIKFIGRWLKKIIAQRSDARQIAGTPESAKIPTREERERLTEAALEEIRKTAPDHVQSWIASGSW